MSYFTRWKALAVIPMTLVVCLSAAPLVFPEARAGVPPESARWLLLVADQKGGVSLLLEVDPDYVKKALLDQTRDDVRYALRDAKIAYRGLVAKPDNVEVKIADEAKIAPALAKLREMAQPAGAKGESGLDIADTGGGQFVITVPPAAMTERMRQTIERSIEVIERRVSQFGVSVPGIERQVTNRILVKLPGTPDLARLKDLLLKTGRLEVRLVDLSVTPEEAQQGKTPPDADLLMSLAAPKTPYVVRKQVLVSGSDITDAQPGFDRRSNEAIVSFRFNSAGARKFAQATSDNVGKPFAIVLDNEVISAAIVREPITGGAGQISGNFTVQQANDLAILFRAGALPAPLTVIDERSKI
jgi:protein-export membrane protein SecD